MPGSLPLGYCASLTKNTIHPSGADVWLLGDSFVCSQHTQDKDLSILLALGKLSTLSKPKPLHCLCCKRREERYRSHFREYLLQNEPVWIFLNQHLKMKTFTKPLEDVLYIFLLHCSTTSLYIIYRSWLWMNYNRHVHIHVYWGTPRGS